jgi:hypothetical protein
METTVEAENLLRLLPPIRRARLWRLYAENGRRFLDLWMDGGRSILGAKGTNLGTAAKAAIDMGLARPLPSVWERRLEKSILEAFPGYVGVRFYRNMDSALAELACLRGVKDGPVTLIDPATRETDADRTRDPLTVRVADALVLRPFASFLPQVPGADGIPYALPLLPCPASFAPGAILFRADAVAPHGELAPPIALSTAVRALRELDRLTLTYTEAHWKRAEKRLSPFFERQGPYLYPRHTRTEHEAFFRAALDAGLLVSPEYTHPSLVPPDFDDGELAALVGR